MSPEHQVSRKVTFHRVSFFTKLQFGKLNKSIKIIFQFVTRSLDSSSKRYGQNKQNEYNSTRRHDSAMEFYVKLSCPNHIGGWTWGSTNIHAYWRLGWMLNWEEEKTQYTVRKPHRNICGSLALICALGKRQRLCLKAVALMPWKEIGAVAFHSHQTGDGASPTPDGSTPATVHEKLAAP